MFKSYLKFPVSNLVYWALKLGKFKWIVTCEPGNTPEPGFRVFGVNVHYYKWYDEPLIYRDTPSEQPDWKDAPKRSIVVDPTRNTY